MRFNPTKVRLKDRQSNGGVRPTTPLQPHEGSSERVVIAALAIVASELQPHEGSSERHEIKKVCDALEGFNPTKVRLKVRIARPVLL